MFPLPFKTVQCTCCGQVDPVCCSNEEDKEPSTINKTEMAHHAFLCRRCHTETAPALALTRKPLSFEERCPFLIADPVFTFGAFILKHRYKAVRQQRYVIRVYGTEPNLLLNDVRRETSNNQLQNDEGRKNPQESSVIAGQDANSHSLSPERYLLNYCLKEGKSVTQEFWRLNPPDLILRRLSTMTNRRASQCRFGFPPAMNSSGNPQEPPM